ncbi:MAG: hypothetical protein JWM55_762 [Acidimicrobiaceae bacterium]|nr:hypothetical protein [Acidimicrobiaceae bacterium]
MLRVNRDRIQRGLHCHVRRLIPFSILAALIVASLVTLRLSYDQSHSPRDVSITLSCSKNVGQRPAGYVLFCADANAEFTHLSWQDWGDATAYGTGTARWNDCTPNCAAGTWKSEPVTVWAWRIRDHRYTRLSSSDTALMSSIVVKSYPA